MSSERLGYQVYTQLWQDASCSLGAARHAHGGQPLRLSALLCAALFRVAAVFKQRGMDTFGFLRRIIRSGTRVFGRQNNRDQGLQGIYILFGHLLKRCIVRIMSRYMSLEQSGNASGCSPGRFWLIANLCPRRLACSDFSLESKPRGWFKFLIVFIYTWLPFLLGECACVTLPRSAQCQWSAVGIATIGHIERFCQDTRLLTSRRQLTKNSSFQSLPVRILTGKCSRMPADSTAQERQGGVESLGPALRPMVFLHHIGQKTLRFRPGSFHSYTGGGFVSGISASPPVW